ncbi:MAG: transposase [Bacteroidales bacterium]|nr:transposase [Bacteroidales bacterium]
MGTSYSSEVRFYLVTTDHLTDKIWFRDDIDFKVAMNYVAIVSFVNGVKVLAFILMSNHVHFILQCSEKDAHAFIEEFKRRYGMHLNKKYGVKDFLRHNKVDIQELSLNDESLERGIAYVLMNSVAANICLNAADYPWGSAGIYFRVGNQKGAKLGDLSGRARIRILHSRENLPGWMLLGEEGFILPDSYVPVKFVESVFRTPKRMNYFLMNSSKAKRCLAGHEKSLPSFKDQVIAAAIPDICKYFFRKYSPNELEPSEMATLVAEVKWRFSADPNQIARVLGIGYSDTVSLLEGF